MAEERMKYLVDCGVCLPEVFKTREEALEYAQKFMEESRREAARDGCWDWDGNVVRVYVLLEEHEVLPCEPPEGEEDKDWADWQQTYPEKEEKNNGH